MTKIQPNRQKNTNWQKNKTNCIQIVDTFGIRVQNSKASYQIALNGEQKS